MKAPPGFWAFVSNPRFYDVRADLAHGVELYWIVRRADVGAGDRVAIWKSKANEQKRGIVALAEVLEDPEMIQLVPLKGWKVPPPAAKVRSVKMRLLSSKLLPLWLEDDVSGVLRQLSVARATGGGVFKIEDRHWTRVMDLIGGWPTH